MGQELQKLNSRHMLVMRLMLTGAYQQKQIAALTGFTREAINYIVNSPAFQDEYARRRDDIEKLENNEIVNSIDLVGTMIQNAAIPAAAELQKLSTDSADDNIKLRASESILKMAFGREPAKGPQVQNVFVLDSSQLSFMKKVASEAGIIDGDKRESNPSTDGQPESVDARPVQVDQDKG